MRGRGLSKAGTKEFDGNNRFFCLILCLFMGFGGAVRAQDKEGVDVEKRERALGEEPADFKEGEVKSREEEEKHVAALKVIHKKLVERTAECGATLDSLLFTLQAMAKQAHKKGETGREKEILSVLIDYNSVKGDLDAINALLDMAGLAGDDEFNRYFDLMARGYEYLKGDFNLKNELFLRRISGLRDKDALRYEKKLYGLFCDYFEYDFWHNSHDWPVQESGEDKVAREESRE